MKLKNSNHFLAASIATLASVTLHANGDQTRSASADTLDLGTAWVSTTLPTTADVALWDASSTLANTMGANNTWGGLNVSAASGAVSIEGANNLLLDHTTDSATVFNTGSRNFTWGSAGVGGNFNINGVAGSASSIAQGATFSGSGLVTISSTGTKNWSNNGTTNGVTQVSFTGTIALRGAAIPAQGVLSGNWLAFGGGGGAASDVGTAVQTGAFSLDTGDASSCGSLILTQGFSGQFLKLNSLQGTGSIRTDWGISAGTQTRGIELNQAGDTVLSGSILAHSGSNQRRNVTFVKKGAGKLTLTGGLGVSGGTASLNFDVQGGAIQLGDGFTNPVYVNPAGWDAASTFNLAAGAKLLFATDGGFTWSHALTGGTGTVEINAGGNVAFSANNSAFGGNVNLVTGSLRMGPNLGTGTLTVKSGTYISSGQSATNGVSQVGALVLEDATESDFRLGTGNDQILVTGALTAPAGGTHKINLFDTPTAGGTIKLIDYSGTALTASQFSRFVLGVLPGGTASFALVNNTAETSIDLLITLEEQVWKGSTNGNWDAITKNWALASAPGTPVLFNEGNPALFNDSASIYSVVVDATGVYPLKTTFNNSANAYTLTGGEIFGTSSLLKNGTASVTLSQANSYSGGTTVNAGTLLFNGASNMSSGGVTVNGGKLQIGAGGTEGDIGSGAVVVKAGATLEFNRSNVTPGTPDFDYKNSVKMRNVSGAGEIVLTGGAMLFNYTGSGLGFADANSWAGFSGNLTVKGGSEFESIRNGATAMGTGSVILGDGASSGSLSQIEGNWTWTNNISLVGADNKILNRATGTNRSLKLQGVISGSGGLTLEDPALAMNIVNRGYILTGANTMNGILTIAAAVPVRVGGVPGNTDVTQSAADAFGSLGAATVVNNGTLTFSRTDATSVSNGISGSGALRIGIPVADGFGDTTTQILTYTGTASHTGETTVNNGVLIVGSGGSINGSSLVTVAAAGTLAGVGTITAPVTAAGTIAPGTSVGTLPVIGDTMVTGTLAIEVNGASGDKLSVTGSLDFTGSTLTVAEPGAGFTAPSYVIAECTGTLTSLPVAPIGYAVNAVGKQVILTKVDAGDYDTWISGFTFPVGADKTPSGDPDNDGLTNQSEYAFGLIPNSGSSVNPITAQLNKTTGLFTYTRRKPSLTGLKYTYEYSTTLASWTVFVPDDTTSNNGDPVEAITVDVPTVDVPNEHLTNGKLFVRVIAK